MWKGGEMAIGLSWLGGSASVEEERIGYGR